MLPLAARSFRLRSREAFALAWEVGQELILIDSAIFHRKHTTGKPCLAMSDSVC
jgi:hypothetical protein